MTTLQAQILGVVFLCAFTLGVLETVRLSGPSVRHASHAAYAMGECRRQGLGLGFGFHCRVPDRMIEMGSIERYGR